MWQNILTFMLECKICGLGCCRSVAESFWYIDGTENGESLLGSEVSGKGELTC